MTEALQYVTLADIEPAPDNLRTHMTEIEGLAESIVANGVLTPLTLTQNGNDKLKIVAGHRRQAAIEMAVGDGRLEAGYRIPAYVRDFEDAGRIQAMVVENIQRQDLNPIEEAQGYARLRDEFGQSQDDIAAKVGRNQSHISKRLMLLNLDPKAQALVARGKLPIEVAQLLSRVPVDQQLDLVEMRGGPDQISEYHVEAYLTRLKAEEKVAAFAEKAAKAGLPVTDRAELTSDYQMTGESFTKITEAKAYVASAEWNEDLWLVAQESSGTPVLRVYGPKGRKLSDGSKASDPAKVAARVERLFRKFWLEAVIAVVTKVSKARLTDVLLHAFWNAELTATTAGDVVRILNVEPIVRQERQTNYQTGEVVERNVKDNHETARQYAASGDKQFLQSVFALVVAKYGYQDVVKEALLALGVDEAALREQAKEA